MARKRLTAAGPRWKRGDLLADDKVTGEHAGGCAIIVWSLFVLTPMWLLLLFALMQANEMPMWSWVLYFCYVPAHLIGVAIRAFLEVVKK